MLYLVQHTPSIPITVQHVSAPGGIPALEQAGGGDPEVVWAVWHRKAKTATINIWVAHHSTSQCMANTWCHHNDIILASWWHHHVLVYLYWLIVKRWALRIDTKSAICIAMYTPGEMWALSCTSYHSLRCGLLSLHLGFGESSAALLIKVQFVKENLTHTHTYMHENWISQLRLFEPACDMSFSYYHKKYSN